MTEKKSNNIHDDVLGHTLLWLSLEFFMRQNSQRIEKPAHFEREPVYLVWLYYIKDLLEEEKSTEKPLCHLLLTCSIRKIKKLVRRIYRERRRNRSSTALLKKIQKNWSFFKKFRWNFLFFWRQWRVMKTKYRSRIIISLFHR